LFNKLNERKIVSIMKLQKILFGLLLFSGINNFAMDQQGSEVDGARLELPGRNIPVAMRCVCSLAKIWPDVVRKDYATKFPGSHLPYKKLPDCYSSTTIESLSRFAKDLRHVNSNGALLRPELNKNGQRVIRSSQDQTYSSKKDFLEASGYVNTAEVPYLQLEDAYDRYLATRLCQPCTPFNPARAIGQRMARQVVIAPGRIPSPAEVVHGLQHAMADVENADNKWLTVELNKTKREIKEEYQAKRLRPATWPKFDKNGKAK
jgi:hypothetical protein